VIDNASVPFNEQTNQWELVVRNGQLTVDGTITVDLLATDFANRQTTAQRVLNVQAVTHEPIQMVNRLTFGATPTLLDYISNIGPDAFLAEQLAPDTIDDSEFEDQMAGFTPQTKDELKWYALQHMLYSRRQLQEVMTWFWDNHFNTNLNTHGEVAYELAENNAFRQLALGNFRDLLEASAKSAAMLLYLNNHENVNTAPNENYAREIMELHTLGVDGGYDAEDVRQLSRIFTGWQHENGQFVFNSSVHSTGDKELLGVVISEGGVNEGEQALDILAMHPSTARFICRKLSVLFVADESSDSLVDGCASEYINSDGHIGTVITYLVQSPDFADSQMFRNKVKTPVEMVTGVVRNFSAQTDGTGLDQAMRSMGLNLFENPVPTGWSEVGEDWINSNLILQRTRFVNDVAYNTNANGSLYIDIRNHLLDQNLVSAQAIVAHLLQVSVGGDYSPLEYQIGVDVLNEGSEPFDINSVDAETRLRRLLGHLLSYPSYQFQ
jgi:uncharacterized protein (DUF1800 family)